MSATQPMPHIPVMLHEAVQGLVTRRDGIYVDGTFGRGGHTRAVLALLAPSARVVAFDKDPAAVVAAKALDDQRLTIVHSSFAALREVLSGLGVAAVDGVLLDLGISSPQIDTPERGFSFRFDAPLDMRMDTTRGETAADFLQRADERHIAQVIRDYGEERFAMQIARAVVARRVAGEPVRSTRALADLVARTVKTREAGQDPATRTFQALRISVNAELDELEQGLVSALDMLSPGGRLAVISFHSLEDRIVKQFMARESRQAFDRRAPFAPVKPCRLEAVSRVKPSAAEVAANPRARSAVLRLAQRSAGLVPSPPHGKAPC
jgi:16S rRNA (cytosine1402-N4)-methyltransferase